jgi:hypothetical protein
MEDTYIKARRFLDRSRGCEQVDYGEYHAGGADYVGKAV